jgi:hypothetical protein
MTTATFDAPASTPRYNHRTVSSHRIRKPSERPLIRVAWLIARLCRREFVSYERYHERFGVSFRSFGRDIALLRDAGMYLEAHPTHGYKLLWFGADVEGG